MKVPINIRQVKIRQAVCEVSKGFNYGETVLFNGTGEVISIVGKNTQDGQQNVDYIVKPQLVSVRKSDAEIVTPATDGLEPVKQTSRSQALRNRCLAIGMEIGENGQGIYEKAIEAAHDWLTNYKEESMGYPHDDIRKDS